MNDSDTKTATIVVGLLVAAIGVIVLLVAVTGFTIAHPRTLLGIGFEEPDPLAMLVGFGMIVLGIIAMLLADRLGLFATRRSWRKDFFARNAPLGLEERAIERAVRDLRRDPRYAKATFSRVASAIANQLARSDPSRRDPADPFPYEALAAYQRNAKRSHILRYGV